MKMVESFERLSEERYYQQSKRSQYYKDYHKEFQLVKEEIKSSSITSEKNDLYCLQYAGYILNNSTGLASLWSNIHLGCQSKHSREQSYLEWSKTFGNCDCVTNLPRTQGIIELHQKITKHITLSTKKQRVDSVIADLKSKKISSHRLYQINLSRTEKKSQISNRKLC